MRRNYHSSILFLIFFGLPNVFAFKNYQKRIPNGHHVPNPCWHNSSKSPSDSSTSEAHWPGVGHKHREGRGELNAFGKDFKNNGHRWTKSLCQKDSDGDGMTNGQELGDPDCQWSVGEDPVSTGRITHPGVCDPIGAPQCAVYNSFLPCLLGDSSQQQQQQSGGSSSLKAGSQKSSDQTGIVADNPQPSSAIASGAYLQRILMSDVVIHRQTSLCPQRNGTSPQAHGGSPRSHADAKRCHSDTDCPNGYSCVVGPTNFYEMTLCCPSVVEINDTTNHHSQVGSSSSSSFDHYYSSSSNDNQQQQQQQHQSLASIVSSRDRCLLEPSLDGQLCSPPIISWYYHKGDASCQPFYTNGQQCDASQFFHTKDECLQTCQPVPVARWLFYKNSNPIKARSAIHHDEYHDAGGDNGQMYYFNFGN